MNFIAPILLLLIASLGVVFTRRKAVDSLPVFVICAQTFFGFTQSLYLDFYYFSDQRYFFFTLVALFSCVCATVLFTPFVARRPSFPQHVLPTSLSSLYRAVFFLLLSVMTISVYYWFGGVNLFWSLISGSLLDDFSTLRLSLYSSSQFSGAGIANQFKNVIFPISSFVLLFWLFKETRVHRGIKIYLGVFWLFFLLWSLLGTGQRAPLVYVFMSFFFSLLLLRLVNYKQIIALGGVVICLFLVFTVLNNRADSTDALGLFSSLVTRLIYNDQYEGLLAFYYVDSLPNAVFGDWLMDLRGLHPSYKGSRLSHDIFATIHGTDRGMAGVPTIVSVLYNGGVILVPIFYFSLGAVAVFIQHRWRSGPPTSERAAIYGSVYMLITLFFTGAPVSLLNKGGLGVIMYILFRRLKL